MLIDNCQQEATQYRSLLPAALRDDGLPYSGYFGEFMAGASFLPGANVLGTIAGEFRKLRYALSNYKPTIRALQLEIY